MRSKTLSIALAGSWADSQWGTVHAFPSPASSPADGITQRIREKGEARDGHGCETMNIGKGLVRLRPT